MTLGKLHRIDFVNKVSCCMCNKQIPRYWNEPVSGYCSDACFQKHMRQQLSEGLDVLMPFVPLQITRLIFPDRKL